MAKIIEKYKFDMTGHGIYDSEHMPVGKFFKGQRIKINPNIGQGWTEFLEMDNGLCIGLSEYQLNKTLSSSSKYINTPLQFNIMLKGNFNFKIGSSYKHLVSSGDIWVWNDLNETIFRTQPCENKICGVTLTLPISLVKSWLNESCCEASHNLERLVRQGLSQKNNKCQQIFPLAQGINKSSLIMRMAKELFRLERNTLYGKLQFEARALDLLSQILVLDFQGTRNNLAKNWKKRAAVDEAIDILNAEWANPPTISTLARRVSLNECYLKYAFHEETGLTIGKFVRDLRMEKALELIESGQYSILEIALIVGYSNPSHFASVFKRFYGHLPSYFTNAKKN